MRAARVALAFQGTGHDAQLVVGAKVGVFAVAGEVVVGVPEGIVGPREVVGAGDVGAGDLAVGRVREAVAEAVVEVVAADVGVVGEAVVGVRKLCWKARSNTLENESLL